MAGLAPADVDMVQLYDCYTITALLTIEDSGFCGEGEGMAFVDDHDLSYRGDFPCNTHGGQLGHGPDRAERRDVARASRACGRSRVEPASGSCAATTPPT